MKKVIREHIHAGTDVWSDGHASYTWLDSDADYTHAVVVHSQGEFSRRRADQLGRRTFFQDKETSTNVPGLSKEKDTLRFFPG
eukprot:2845223-Amphidinium_carterae.1